MCIDIMYIVNYIKVNYAINRIYQIRLVYTKKNISFDELLTTSYFLLLFVRTW